MTIFRIECGLHIGARGEEVVVLVLSASVPDLNVQFKDRGIGFGLDGRGIVSSSILNRPPFGLTFVG